MNLRKIALSIVAALGVVTVGGSWYTGKQVEEKYQELIELTNKQFGQFNNQFWESFEVKDLQIKRHFFSSDARYRLEIKMAGGEKFDFIGNDKIYHGPLPLNRLAKFNLVPVMLSMRSHIKAPLLFFMMGEDEFGFGEGNIGYSGSADGEFVISKIKLIDNGEGIESSPIKIGYRYDPKGKNIGGTVNIEQLDIKSSEMNIAVNSLIYEFDLADNPNYRNVNFGKGKLKVKSIEGANSEEGNVFQLKGLNAKGENLLKGDRLLSSSDAVADSIKFSGIDIGKWKMDVASDLDAKLVDKTVPALVNPAFVNIGGEEDAVDIERSLWQLLSKSPKLHLNTFSLEKNKSKFDLSLMVNLTQIDPQSISNVDTVLKALSQSKFSINVNREYMEDIVREVGMTKENLNEEQAKTKANQEVNMVFSNVVSSDLVVAEGNNLKSELIIDNGKITLNGRETSADEVGSLLFFFMIGVNGFDK